MSIAKTVPDCMPRLRTPYLACRSVATVVANAAGNRIAKPASIIDVFEAYSPPRALDVPERGRPAEASEWAGVPQYAESIAVMNHGLDAWQAGDLKTATRLLSESIRLCPGNGNASVHKAGLDIVCGNDIEKAYGDLCTIHLITGRVYPNARFYQALRFGKSQYWGDAYSYVLAGLRDAPDDRSLLAAKKAIELGFEDFESPS